MTIREVLTQIDRLSPNATIYASDITNLDNDATVYEGDDADQPEYVGSMQLVMDVWHVKETLEGLQSLMRQQTGVAPSQAQLFERFQVYLKNNA